MKIIAVIPARYASTRFPAKLMQDLGGKTVILRTYEAATASGLFDDVFVVTDSYIIYDNIVSNGGNAIKNLTIAKDDVVKLDPIKFSKGLDKLYKDIVSTSVLELLFYSIYSVNKE
jgi:CMP-N-acetylneuraminic acid synthetase